MLCLLVLLLVVSLVLLLVLLRRAKFWTGRPLLRHTSRLLRYGTELLLLWHLYRALLELSWCAGLTNTLGYRVMRWYWRLAHGATALLDLVEVLHGHESDEAECAKARGSVVFFLYKTGMKRRR